MSSPWYYLIVSWTKSTMENGGEINFTLHLTTFTRIKLVSVSVLPNPMWITGATLGLDVG